MSTRFEGHAFTNKVIITESQVRLEHPLKGLLWSVPLARVERVHSKFDTLFAEITLHTRDKEYKIEKLPRQEAEQISQFFPNAELIQDENAGYIALKRTSGQTKKIFGKFFGKKD